MMRRSCSKRPPRRTTKVEDSPSTQDEPENNGDEREYEAHPQRPDGRGQEGQLAHQ
jgi:hypothetical protein